MALSEFLDYFYTADHDERCRSLLDEPILLKSARNNALFAAVAEHLSTNYTDVPPPLWIEGADRFCRTPWFTAKAPDDTLKEYLTYTSPAAFKRRNIMTEPSPLLRATTPQT